MYRNLRTLILAGIAIGALAACQPAYEGPRGAARVGMVGDSITYQSTDALRSGLAVYQRSIVGIPGIALGSGRSKLIEPLVVSRPDVAVVELGVNSAMNGWTSTDAGELDRTLALLDAIPCTVWVLPSATDASTLNGFGPGLLVDRIAAFHTALSNRLAAHPHIHLADFGPTELAHPSWFSADGLHPSPAGRTGLATFVHTAVASEC